MTAGYNATLVLRIVGVSRSTYYYQLTHEPKPHTTTGRRPFPGHSLTVGGRKVSDEQIKEWIMESISGDGYAYGYRKLTHMLRQDHELVVNEKKVYRLCKELDILRPQRNLRRKHPRNLAQNRTITAPNQLWEVDVKYGYIAGEDRFFFVLSYIDVYDRQIVGYHIGLTCEARHAVETFRAALWKRQILQRNLPLPIIRSDNGPQFVSHLFESECERWNVLHERIPPKTPNMNAYIESYHRLLEDECLSMGEFGTYAEAYQAVVEFVSRYNNRRLHSSLHYLSPAKFYRRHIETGLQPRYPVRV
ncbi:IS3 family transposase [Neomoorella thermoacetica]|uniref:IS3 family transposase n=1 Tax=Neomoorella thermoacetica TaxID=1525 RepID=UPI0021750462|nr:IS3 family transposase [Moorella thermoacetica]